MVKSIKELNIAFTSHFYYYYCLKELKTQNNKLVADRSRYKLRFDRKVVSNSLTEICCSSWKRCPNPDKAITHNTAFLILSSFLKA